MKGGVFLKSNNDCDKVLKELYDDFLKKRNENKIEIDNYETEKEIIRRKIEYSENIEDESKLFSPRELDKRKVDSVDELEAQQEELELMLEEYRKKYSYYNDYCNKLKPFVIKENNEESDAAADAVEATEKFINEHMNEDVVYNLSLNYDFDKVRDKLSGIMHKLEVCLKILDNDSDRAKNEIKSINRSLKRLLESMK